MTITAEDVRETHVNWRFTDEGHWVVAIDRSLDGTNR